MKPTSRIWLEHCLRAVWVAYKELLKMLCGGGPCLDCCGPAKQQTQQVYTRCDVGCAIKSPRAKGYQAAMHLASQMRCLHFVNLNIVNQCTWNC